MHNRENRKSISPQFCHSFQPLAESDLQDIAFPAIAFPEAIIKADIFSRSARKGPTCNQEECRKSPLRDRCHIAFPFEMKNRAQFLPQERSRNIILLSRCRDFLFLMFPILTSNFLWTKRCKKLRNEPHFFTSIAFSSRWFLDFSLIKYLYFHNAALSKVFLYRSDIVRQTVWRSR